MLPSIHWILIAAVEESANRCPMRQIPTEVNLGGDELSAPDGVGLTIAKALAAGSSPFIHDDCAICVFESVDIVKGRYLVAVRPAALEVSLSIECIVEWAAEVILVVEQHFQGRAVLVYIGPVTGFGYVEWCFHVGSPRKFQQINRQPPGR
jgi:hypothetical protein